MKAPVSSHTLWGKLCSAGEQSRNSKERAQWSVSSSILWIKYKTYQLATCGSSYMASRQSVSQLANYLNLSKPEAEQIETRHLQALSDQMSSQQFIINNILLQCRGEWISFFCFKPLNCALNWLKSLFGRGWRSTQCHVMQGCASTGFHFCIRPSTLIHLWACVSLPAGTQSTQRCAA